MDDPMNIIREPEKLKHAEITDKILHVFYKRVYPALGYGFLEKVYHNAIFFALESEGLKVLREAPINVYFENHQVGEYYADLMIEDKVIVELKTVDFIRPEHEAQLLNYLRATHCEVGLLLNFGKKPEFKRLAYDNSRKISRS